MSIGNFNTKNISKQTSLAFWISFTLVGALGIWSAICPPQGVIDSSILKFATIMFGFVPLAIVREAIKEGLGLKYKHGETEIEIDS